MESKYACIAACLPSNLSLCSFSDDKRRGTGPAPSKAAGLPSDLTVCLFSDDERRGTAGPAPCKAAGFPPDLSVCFFSDEGTRDTGLTPWAAFRLSSNVSLFSLSDGVTRCAGSTPESKKNS